MDDFEASYAAFRQRREKLLQRERDLRLPEVVRKDFTDSLIYRTNENALQPAPQQQIDPWADWNRWCDSRINARLAEFIEQNDREITEDFQLYDKEINKDLRTLNDAIKAERETVLMPAIAEALSLRVCTLRDELCREFDKKLAKLRDELKGGTNG